MIKKLISAALFGFILFSVFSNPALAAENKKKRPKTGKAAIILASFGTTVPSAVGSIINIQQKVQAAFPEVPVRVTFTSNIIRKVWKKRQAEAKKWLDQGIPPEILYVKNIISTFGDLREEGYRDIVVQPTHMSPTIWPNMSRPCVPYKPSRKNGGLLIKSPWAGRPWVPSAINTNTRRTSKKR
jgi:sirohydrochlorin cobaltochelatase